MKADRYLERIGADKPFMLRGTLSYLTHLQYRHMLSVPFENLDVMNHVPITLDIATFYDKVVWRGRGGFCYELNGLFHWLLQQLQYDVYFISGTVKKPDGTWALADSHAAVIAQLEKPYLVDVGFGDSARIPTPLTGEEINDGGRLYRAAPSETKDGAYLFQTKKEGEWVTLYRFYDHPKVLTDFAPMCRYNQTSPESRFTQESIATIATENGRVTLLNDTLKVTEGKSKIEEEIALHHREDILQKYFGIMMTSL
ncbi:N-hydroxyarylamine O-acetyltransferase [Alteribacillus persepolensis]|uniref:N-hydroxyarylamine O-acetyltransferase n=1 Tax=Alteribacillus persepolensis TaxID=568899 RepID=A0A1G8J921_9BACI|nr:arylamine N-acetyltransferase [Alteribacillus persepolensis]SDI27759.1 N-hydroxyarylamine O-acetyltransferase [Alteribacillus persepolensis]